MLRWDWRGSKAEGHPQHDMARPQGEPVYGYLLWLVGWGSGALLCCIIVVSEGDLGVRLAARRMDLSVRPRAPARGGVNVDVEVDTGVDVLRVFEESL